MIAERGRGEPAGFHCDGCPAAFRSEHAAFMPALEELKAAGWGVRPVDGEWCHFCPDCRAQHDKSAGRGLL